MAVTDIPLQLNSYPDASSTSAIEQGVEIAAILQARITALTFKFKIKVPGTIVHGGLFRIPPCLQERRRQPVAAVDHVPLAVV